jgi:hypothetical protein
MRTDYGSEKAYAYRTEIKCEKQHQQAGSGSTSDRAPDLVDDTGIDAGKCIQYLDFNRDKNPGAGGRTYNLRKAYQFGI